MNRGAKCNSITNPSLEPSTKVSQPIRYMSLYSNFGRHRSIRMGEARCNVMQGFWTSLKVPQIAIQMRLPHVKSMQRPVVRRLVLYLLFYT